jgi:glycosyltransferase involved in cell wall biosynthesis
VSIAGTDGSLKLHPLHSTRALAELGAAGLQLRRAARRRRVDLIHANSIRIALPVVASRDLGGPACIAHVHECLPPGRVSNAVHRVISRADRVLVNSRHTRRLFQRAVPGSAPEVLYNGVDLRRFNPARHDRAAARAAFAVPTGDVALGVVAQITPWKGQEEAMRTTVALRAMGLPVQLLLAGSAVFVTPRTRYDNRSYEEKLRRLASSLGLGAAVRFLGQQAEIPRLLRALDMLLVPSWEEPFGRVVVEAMAMGVPVAATTVGGPREILLEGESGVLLPPREPEAWAVALAPLLRDRARLAAMGQAARRRAQQQFALEGLTAQLTEVYGGLTTEVRPR